MQRLRLRRGEQGFAMIIVLLLTAIMSTLIVIATQDAISGLNVSRYNENWNAAMGAAEAGVSDFIYRLNSNESSSYCISLAAENGLPPGAPCSPVTVPPASVGNVQVPDNSNAYVSCYNYKVPTNGLPFGTTSGATAILLDVNGWIAKSSCAGTSPILAERQIQVTLTRNTYLNYAYFTDLETQDPAQYNPNLSSEFSSVSTAQADADQYCSNYYFAIGPNNTIGTKPSGGIALTASTDIRQNHSNTGSYTSYAPNTICTYTKFSGGDSFDGPVHTNDVFDFNGATTFNGPVSVSHDVSETQNPLASEPTCGNPALPSSSNYYDEGDLWVDTDIAVGTDTYPPNFTPAFNAGITCIPPIPLPTENSNLKQEAISGGCLYQGLTYFAFNGNNITVYSPGTPLGTAGLSGACPVNGTFNPSSNANFNGVIYVQNLSSTCTLYPINPSTTPFGTILQANDLNQLVNDPSGSAGFNANAYDCHDGDAFVGGSMAGQLTIGSDNDAVVYQDLLYNDDSGTAVSSTSSNVLGLEPQNSVQIYHPVTCPGWTTTSVAKGTEPSYASCYNSSNGNIDTNLLSPPPSVGNCANEAACTTSYIQAAILCFNGEFTAENWTYGSNLGQMTVTGSVTQRYRGRLAGTSNSAGYGKTYGYDSRLTYITPPYFLPPNIFSWAESSFAETTADGTH